MKEIFLFLLIILNGTVDCAKILSIFNYPGRSHYMGGAALMKVLSENGHDITMVSSIGEEKPRKNYKDVILTEVADFGKGALKDGFHLKVHPYLSTYTYHQLFIPMVNLTLSSPKLKEILKENFDLVIIEQFYNDGLAYIPYKLNIPLIRYSSLGAGTWTNYLVSNPAPSSYIPHVFQRYTNEMTFFQRMDNFITNIIEGLVLNFLILPSHDKIVKENFPEAPNIEEYLYRPSLIFLNGDTSIDEAIPKVPNMIDVGGFHIEPPKNLSENLRKIVDNKEIIYFSMGSVLQSSKLPNGTIDVFSKVFRKFKKQTFLWKFEDENLIGKPDNVIIRKWLPQNDILAHKNVKLFITHGGIRSIQETVYHGVPCLVIPVFADQYLNGKKATKDGYGKVIKLEDVTEENLTENLKELLSKPEYKGKVTIKSKIMKDKLVSPKETILYWIDYAIRHNGTDHLQVAATHLKWYQYYLLDVMVFVLIIIIAIKYLIKLILNQLQSSKLKIKKN